MFLYQPNFILINFITPGAPNKTRNYYPGLATLAAYLIMRFFISNIYLFNEIITLCLAYEVKKGYLKTR